LIENDSKRKIDEWCLIHGFPKGLQNDIFFTKPHPHEAIKNDLRITFDHQKNGSQFSFLDLAYANGADPYFFEILQTMIDLNQIRSFSAWNTTGNRLGTWAAHLSIRHSMDSQNKLNPKKDKLCLWERILDDYAYQGLIRQDLTTLCKKEGLNPWALKERHKEFSEKANQALQLKAQALGCPYPFRASLPWPRLFEIEIQFSL
jgi:hypothetical protein